MPHCIVLNTPALCLGGTQFKSWQENNYHDRNFNDSPQSIQVNVWTAP
jgi:hypothetical protein